MKIQRTPRSRRQDPRSVPWEVDGETEVVAVDTTWGELQPLEVAPGVRTVGELELLDLLEGGARLVDSRTSGSFGGRTIPGAVNIPHDQTVERQAELTRDGLNVLFCNGPQCPQSPNAIRQLIADGFPADALAYYRGGMHDWVTLALPTQGFRRLAVTPRGSVSSPRDEEAVMAVEVSIEQLKQARQDGAMVVDVRNDDEYAAGHVSGAASLPLPEVEARMQELPKDQTIYFICQGGGRSGKAADLLGAAGYDVRSVAAGTSAWIEAGGEVTTGSGQG